MACQCEITWSHLDVAVAVEVDAKDVGTAGRPSINIFECEVVYCCAHVYILHDL